MPSLCATAFAVRALSPVAMMIFSPLACSASIASAVVALIGSATATMPASLPSTATNIGVLPSSASASACAASTPMSTFRSSISALLPSAAVLPPTVPVTPLPVTASKCSAACRFDAALGRTVEDRFGQADAPTPSPGWPRRAAPSSSSKRLSRDHIGQLRPAFGQRAGLVDDQRIDLGEALQRLGVADQHAGLRAAPRRGHDRHRRRQPQRAGTGDDQHRHGGHDGIDHRRLRSEQCPGDERDDGDQHHRRHEIGGHPVGQPLDRRARRAAPWPPSRQCATASSRRRPSAPRITSEPFLFSVPPVSASPACFATGNGSPVIIDSSTDELPSSTTPSTGTLSPGRTRSRSPACT